ncbi:MAG: hypothetical protein AUJ01_13760 [Acidobacteria bacterium 13_1_40CM_3_65_5]|nr:MAG: hypothetical protein AUJ01_13760 [Acidobacteria bacterium 13_1_40CM_3_65_5]
MRGFPICTGQTNTVNLRGRVSVRIAPQSEVWPQVVAAVRRLLSIVEYIARRPLGSGRFDEITRLDGMRASRSTDRRGPRTQNAIGAAEAASLMLNARIDDPFGVDR